MRRRNLLKTAAGLGVVFLAGCSGSDSDGDPKTGTFRLLISDQPAAIGDFDSLAVTLSSARIYRADEDEAITTGVVNDTPDTSEADGNEGFVEIDLDDVSVDLTQVTGDRAVSVLKGELEEGRYSGIELHVANAEGVVEGETVDVMVPSERLRIIKPFEIGAGAELSFVFDINVVQKGPMGDYNLLPVIGKSGVAGRDVEVEEVDIDET